jgi:alpha-ribazole phosphatase
VAVEGICYGQSDVPTGVDAVSACELLLAQLARWPVRIQHVWASPWTRAREPAERIASKLGVPLRVDPRLSELAFGDWEGRPYAELERDPAFRSWMADWREAAPPGGERLADLTARVLGWRAEVIARDEALLAVTHAGVIRTLRAADRGVTYETVVGERVETLAVERFGSGRGARLGSRQPGG